MQQQAGPTPSVVKMLNEPTPSATQSSPLLTQQLNQPPSGQPFMGQQTVRMGMSPLMQPQQQQQQLLLEPKVR